MSVPASELRAGLTATIIAGQGCGTTARVETAMTPDGQRALVLGTTECESRCSFGTLSPVDTTVCAGRCDPCSAAAH